MYDFTEGDYKKVLRKNQKVNFDINQNELEVFLLDFFPYDESRLRYLEGSSQNNEEEEEEINFDEEVDDEEDIGDKPYSDEEENSNDEEAHKSSTNQKTKKTNNFRVRVFGLAKHGDQHFSISVDFTGFRPFFFIKIPDHWTNHQLDTFTEQLKSEANKDPKSRYFYANTLVETSVVKAKPFYGFTADDQFLYAKLVFENLSGFQNYRRLFSDLQRENPKYWKKYKLFESKIEPALRLLHLQEITPSGWIKIPQGKAERPDVESSDCQYHLRMAYRDVIPLTEKIEIPPIEYASFDIEADSSHGDFPIASKTYQKLAQDIVTEYLKLPKEQLKNSHYIRSVLYTWVSLAFHECYDNNNINRIVTLNDERPDPESMDYLSEVVYQLGFQFHESVQDLIKRGYDPNGVKGHQEYYISKLQLQLESHLPEMDLERCQTGNYRLLAEQLLKEVNRMVASHKQRFLDDPLGCIYFMINLAFNPFCDNDNINYVYTGNHEKPSPQVIENLVPQLYSICQECYNHLNKPKEKKKTEPKVGPKKFLSLPPTEKGQTKLSQSSFIRKKMDKLEKLSQNDENDEKPKKSKEDSTTLAKKSKFDKNRRDRKKKLPAEEDFYRGRYIKPKPQPDPDDPEQKEVKIGRDFYVTWLHELFDQHFPKVEGDPVIQIGTTYKRYGEAELFLKHIICLKGCAKFTNADLIHDENADLFISSPREAIKEAKKLNLETPYIKIIQDRLKDAEQNNIKKPKIPELENLNELIAIARRERQLQRDQSVLRVECYETEAEVLLAWRRLIKESDPDIIVGYNIFGFDLKYLWDRADVLGILEEFQDLGRIRNYRENLVEKKLVSSGLGDNLLYYIPMTGRVLIDLLKVVQSGGYRLPIFKLDFVCNHFLYKRKNDLPPQELFVLQKGSDEDRATIARYCLVDCLLCNRLIDRLEIITNNLGMSRVCKVPLSYLFLRGQGIKILSLVSDITRTEGFLLPTLDRVEGDDEGYEGAIVLDPHKGIYFEASVVADFNSLYPSCMIAWNLSHDAYVEIGGKYDNLPKDQFVDIKYDLFREECLPGRKAKQKVKYGVKTCRFYQPPDGSKSLLPRILQRLLKARKDTRKEQKNYVKGSFEWNVKEGLQLAYKVTANSLYGQVGSRTSAIYLKEIAACTTSCGRTLIHKSRDFMENNYAGAKTIYGDSVTGDTPVLVRDINGQVDVITIEKLANESQWRPYEQFKPMDSNRKEKQQAEIPFQVWTENGWSDIRRVIRHKTKKNLYRVNSYMGCVDVTEDHSLLDNNGNKISPKKCRAVDMVKLTKDQITKMNNNEELDDIEDGESSEDLDEVSNDVTSLLHSFPTDFSSEIPAIVPRVGKLKIHWHKGEEFVCSECKVKQPHDSFYFSMWNGRERRQGQCKLCIKRKQFARRGKEFNGNLDRKIPEIYRSTYELSEDESWVWGFFMADGSGGHYGEKEKAKNSWAINNQDKTLLTKAMDILNHIEAKHSQFKILDTMDSSNVYKLVPVGSIKYMVDKYRPLFYDHNKYKIVPKIILNADENIRRAFFEGYYAGDGAKKNCYGLEINRISFSCKGKIGTQGLFYLATSLGYKNLVVNTRVDKMNVYRIYTNESASDSQRVKIRRIIDMGSTQSDQYVYDLETENGTFCSGIGKLVLKNTDSIFVKYQTTNIRGEQLYGLDSIYKSIELCTEGALAISRTLPKPHNLEFEKAIWPFMLVSKKRYHGHYYTIYGEPKYYANSMGIVLKRRDNAEIVKHIFGGVLDIIMEEHDVQKAKEYAKKESTKLLEGKFDLKMFTITKTLKSYYKNPDQIAHNVLAQRIAERDPGNKVQSNDRMAFAYIKAPESSSGEKVLQGDRIETPEFITENKLDLDYRFYLTNQVMKPVSQIFELVMDEKELAGIFIESLMEYDRKMSGIQRITKWVSPDSKEYRTRVDSIMKKLMKELRDEDDKEPKIDNGDEVFCDQEYN